MEVFINNTTELWASNGVVHIKATGYLPEESMYIEWNAQELIDDLPSLYQFCKMAIEQQEEARSKRYVDFKKKLADEYKGKRGRPRS